MITTPRPMPAEHLHSSACLAHAMICAVENMRDSADGALTFRLMLQENTALAWADEYLTSGTLDCICHSWDIAQEGGCWHAVCACSWKGEPHLAAEIAVQDAVAHAEQVVTAAWEQVTA